MPATPADELPPAGVAARADDGRPGSGDGLTLWLVNQYVNKYPDAGFTRHHLLAHAMSSDGVDTTIFTAANAGPHKQSPDGRRPRRARTETALDTRFVWLPAHDYTGNGLGRIINMVGFGLSVVRHGWNVRRYGVRPPDVVLSSDPQPFASLAGWVLARRYRVPFVYEVRDIWPESLVQILGVPRYHPLVVLFDWMEKFLYRRSSLLVGVLPGIGEHVKARVGRKAPPFVWVPNGIAVETIPGLKEAAAPDEPGAAYDAVTPDAAPAAPAEEFVIVYAGAHGPPNSLDTIIDAAQIIENSAGETGIRVRFDLYGSGVSKEDLIEDVRRRNLTSVHFHDPVPKSRVVNLVRAADASIITYRSIDLYRFGVSPNKVFDYLAAGRPVIVALDAPNDPIALAHAGVFARAEDPADLAAVIRSLAAMPAAERERIGRNGQRYVCENHDMAELGRRLASALRGTVARYRRVG
ncbi:MAG: hypothetical protein BGO26_03830 [Actinobacteria bacterium 69-20]|nr:glycosyltransferase family 4 protein [Actinomycetota bacterium]OJV23944.1 MAG: hypothetical protein BGO26_03830 [Actinobacteria bacterium 69-20]